MFFLEYGIFLFLVIILSFGPASLPWLTYFSEWNLNDFCSAQFLQDMSPSYVKSFKMPLLQWSTCFENNPTWIRTLQSDRTYSLNGTHSLLDRSEMGIEHKLDLRKIDMISKHWGEGEQFPYSRQHWQAQGLSAEGGRGEFNDWLHEMTDYSHIFLLFEKTSSSYFVLYFIKSWKQSLLQWEKARKSW